jgi:hypothetical protein
MNGQLALFDLVDEVTHGGSNGSSRRGALPHGPRGLLKALVQQGLDPDALEPAAWLCLLLDAERAAEEDAA